MYNDDHQLYSTDNDVRDIEVEIWARPWPTQCLTSTLNFVSSVKTTLKTTL